MYDELTNKHLNNLKEKIQALLSSKGIDNTNELSDSLEVRDNELLGYEYFYYLAHGRGPGKHPPPQNIAEWVRTKLGVEEKEIKSVAYLVGRKIANEGTKIYQNNSLGIPLSDLVEETLNDLMTELPNYVASQALTLIYGDKPKETIIISG